MRIKKKTGIMLLSSAAAAVVGISAVSFASWTDTNTQTLTASATTGSVYLFGFASNDTLTFSDSLVPYDQKDATIIDGATTINAALPQYIVYTEAYSITVTLASNTAENATYYVTITDDATAPAAFDPENLGAWKEVSSATSTDVTAKFDYSAPDAANTTVSGKYLYVAMVSKTNTDAKKEFSFNVSLFSENAPLPQA